MRRLLCLIFSVIMLSLLCCLPASAEIQAPYGQGQIGWTAYVICEHLSVRELPSTNATTLQRLSYGTTFAVQNLENGFWDCFLTEEEGPAGYVRSDYIVVDPAWYVTEQSTPVYAWNSTSALKVGLLATGTTLPILHMDKNWVVVSLRGAAGWIRMTELDKEYTGPVSGLE